MTPDERERLEQELWELRFGCSEDEAALRLRIAAEPEIRALWEEVERKARLLEDAARDPAPELRFDAPPHRARRRAPRLLRRLTRTAAAAAVVVALAAGWLGIQAWRCHAAEAVPVITVSAPAAAPDGSPLGFTVDVGTGVRSSVAWRALGDDGAVLAAGTDAVSGTRRFEVPAALPGARRVVVDMLGADPLELSVSPVELTPLVHVTTDKPIYRPGEPLRGRAVFLDRRSLEPAAIDGGRWLRIIDPRGDEVHRSWLGGDAPTHGVVPFAWSVPTDTAGGRYRVEILDARDEGRVVGHADVLVRRFERPLLRKELTLAQATFAPGETVRAEIAVERLGGGGPASGAACVATLVVDGDEVGCSPATLDARGRATIALAVPTAVEHGAARLAVRVIDGGIVETAVKPFVVPTGRVEVQAFPEGGDLVAGFENRVYVECTDPLGRAVEATGRVVDDEGMVVARLPRTDRGRALVAWTPAADRRYAVEVDGPAPARIDLPAPTTDGVLLQALAPRYAAGEPLRVRVATERDASLVVAAFCRGVMVGQATTTGAGAREVAVPLDGRAAGVLRVTVFDAAIQPRAERLVQRAPRDPLRIELRPERAEVAPRDAQRVAVTTRTASGAPVSAVVGLCVSDAAVEAYADETKVGLVDALALFADVEAFDDRAGFLLATDGSAERVDRLLGTRGWRRFVWRDAAAVQDPGRAALLATEGFARRPIVASNAAARDAVIRQRADGLQDARALLAVLAALGLFAVLAHVLAEASARAGRWLGPRVARVSPDFGAGVGGALAVAAALVLLLPAPFGPGALGSLATADSAKSMQRALGRSMTWGAALSDETPSDALILFGGATDTWEYTGTTAPATQPSAGRQDTGLLAELDQDDATRAADLARRTRLPDSGTSTREYAHRAVSDAARTDFTETVCWDPLLVTGPDGTASVSFDVADQVTTWLVRADAHGAGSVGQADARFDSRLPLHLEARAPVEVTDGDRLLLPVAIEARRGEHAELAAVARGALRLDGAPSRDVALKDGRGRALLELTVAGDGDASLEIAAGVGGFRDRVLRDLRVVPRGFPHRRSWAGTLEERSSFEVAVPDGLRGPPRAVLRLYPSTLSTIREGLDGMLQEPHGCFEQTSSTNYPNVLTLAYLRATGGTAPAVEARARALLASGYARLTGFECPSRGYEWFGADPGHTALTAYGVLEFADMAEVFAVDGDMVTRTRGWLLDQRRGDGTFAQNQRHFGFGGAPDDTSAAYSTYALLVAGHPAAELRPEIERLERRAATTGDAYELGLAACALERAQRREAGRAARARLATMQGEDGGVDGAVTSITQSGGDDLRVEATSFAALAWLDDPGHTARARRAMEFLRTKREGRGTFGATQATICALRALVAWAERAPDAPASGRVHVAIDGREVATPSFTREQPDAIDVDLGAALMLAGTHVVALSREGDGVLSWAFDLGYHVDTPADDADAPLAIRTSLAADTVAEGATVAVRVAVENRTPRELPMTMAIVGLPAGLEVPTAVLDDLRRGGAFDAWETRGREVICYWRGMAPEQERAFVLDAVAAVPGTTSGPASRAYLYYTPGAVRWAAPLRVTVRAGP